MCLSASVSFAVGSALLPAGVYCLHAALRKDRRYLLLAFVPIAFGLQQVSEGFVWHGLNMEDDELTRRASVVYLFFAMAFWPFWISLSLFVPESRPRMRLVFALLAAVSLLYFWLYAPIASDSERWLTTNIAGHSVRYEVSGLPGYQVVPRALWRVVYLLIVAVPLALGRIGGTTEPLIGPIGGVLLTGMFLVSYLLFWEAFTSVWCFFGAVLSLMLVFVFHKLPCESRKPDSVSFRAHVSPA